MPSLHTHAPNFHFSTGTQGNAKSLVSQQLYDPKFSTQTYYGETDNMSPPSISRDLRCHHEIIQLPPPPTVLSKQTAYPKLDIELPPLRNIVPCNNNKRARTNSIETNAVIAMMQLSQNSHKEYAGSY
jgi:hypothetical protein